MVSGFFTSPCDHDRIISGDAIEIRIELKASGFLGFSNTPKRSSILRYSLSRYLGALRFFKQLHVEAQRLELLDHYVERFRQSRLERVLALDDRFVHPGPSRHVVRLDGQHLLQRVRGAVGFERPDFHFSQALPAELRLAAQRLLRD